MKRTLISTLGSVVLFSLLTTTGMQFIPNPMANWQWFVASALLRGQERTIVVTSTADNGPGSLRQALLVAQSDDNITFDPVVFPPTAPVTITIISELPHIRQGNLTVDASDAGVILDGSSVSGTWVPGVEIVSDGNTIRGLQISNFSGTGITLSGGAQNNTIGGDCKIGIGPLGQGNQTSLNNVGIGLWGEGTYFNSITGNLIGTDATASDGLGNQGHGIMILEGASNNTLGPANVITGNYGDGINIAHPTSIRNTITQNSIYDNNGIGINLIDGGNTELPAPLIFDFDLSAGTVEGTTCASCIVEILSDSNDEGGIYESQTLADSLGVFMLNKGDSFAGLHLTTTATDIYGNTSQFSIPTSGTSRNLNLQDGNNQPRYLLRTKQSKNLVDNRIAGFTGGGWSTDGEPHDPDHNVNLVTSIGLKRFRFSINNLDSDKVFWDKPEFSIHPDHDELITHLSENGIIITYVMTFWDKATWPGGEDAACPRFKTEGEIQRYLEFVRFIVNHFKDRIQYFEIWNEPDVEFCPQWIEVNDYINLVKRTVPVIRQENPDAKIQVSIAYPRYSEAYDYLLTLLKSDIMPLVDVVSWHPMFGTSPEFDSEYYYTYPAIVREIKEVASTHGFEGEYEADELTYFTIVNDHWDGWSLRYSNTKAAKYHARATVMHLGMDLTAGNGGIPTADPNRANILSTIRSLCTVMAGVKSASLPFTIQSTATNTMSYTFSLPNGDHLIALWTDGVAVDADTGIPAMLTIPGYADHEVTGIGILHGFQQQLVTSEEDDDLVIRDLRVKDYPIILRLYKPKYLFLPGIMKEAVES